MAMAYSNYYPQGGLHDCVGVFLTYDEALRELAKSVADVKEIATIDVDARKVKQVLIENLVDEYESKPSNLTQDS
jgi:hypothetical protein